MEKQTQKILKRSEKVLGDFKYKKSLGFLANRKKKVEEIMNDIQKEIDKNHNSKEIPKLIRRWRIWAGKLKKINEKYYKPF